MKYKCPCCGYYTFEERESYDICPVCFWEDDPVQLNNPTFEGGANEVSLLQAQKNFKEFGACQPGVVSRVRSPKKDELIGID